MKYINSAKYFLIKNKYKVFFGLVLIALVALPIFLCTWINSSANYETIEVEDFEVNETPEIKTINIMHEINKAKMGESLYSEILAKQISTADAIDATKQFGFFGQLQPDGTSVYDVIRNLHEIENFYHEPVSFVLYDLNSDSGIYYQINLQTYLASSIKLPYIASVVENEPEVYWQYQFNIANILQNSSNEDYEFIRDIYGAAAIQNWCVETNTSPNMYKYYYPSFVSAKDLLKMWFKTFYVLNTNMFCAELSQLSEDSLNSAIKMALGQKYRVNTKPGWFDCPDMSDAGYCFDGVTSDAGVIYAGDNPYILIVLSEIPQDIPCIAKLVESLDNAHSSMFY